MVKEQDVLRFVDPSSQESRSARIGMQPLHHAAMSMAEVSRGRGRFKTKDLVGLLLAHGARSWRASSPRVQVRLRVFAPGGETAIKIRC